MVLAKAEALETTVNSKFLSSAGMGDIEIFEKQFFMLAALYNPNW